MSAQIQHFPAASFPIEFILQAPFPAWLKTTDGHCIAANAAADRLMGRRVVGATTEDLYGDDAAQIREYEQAALRDGRHQQVQSVNGQVLIVMRYRAEVHGCAFVGGIALPARVSLHA